MFVYYFILHSYLENPSHAYDGDDVCEDVTIEDDDDEEGERERGGESD